jgi:hypothetical protein
MFVEEEETPKHKLKRQINASVYWLDDKIIDVSIRVALVELHELRLRCSSDQSEVV